MRNAVLIILLAAYGIGMAGPSSAWAMYKNLTPEQRDEAIKYGKSGARKDISEFIREWSVDRGKEGSAFLLTEFLSLAYAASQAALRFAELNNFEIDDALANSSGKLVFRVTLFGSTDDFAKEYSGVLLASGKTIPATFWNQPMGEPFGDGKSKPAFVTDSEYYFPSQGIDMNGSVTLVVQDKNGKEVVKFPFNLSALR
jgi:hypothetical protein